MTRKPALLLAAGMASLLTLGGAAAYAGSDADEIALFQKAAHDATAAITAAEAATGGKAVEAEFDEKDGVGVWEVETVNGTKRVEVRIDATTGAVIATKDKGDIADKKNPVTPETLGTPLAELVSRAEASGGGKLISIDFEHEDGQPVGIEAEVLRPDGSLHEFILAPASAAPAPAAAPDTGGNATGSSNG